MGEIEMRKTAALAACMVMALAAVAFAKDYTITKEVGEYKVEAAFDKNPPVTGKNTLTVDVRDKSGAAVSDASVKVEYSMPAMSGMPAMNYKADAAPSGGKYVAKVDLSMAGPWNVAVKIKRADKTTTVKFTVDVR
jgi:hypothetical protein